MVTAVLYRIYIAENLLNYVQNLLQEFSEQMKAVVIFHTITPQHGQLNPTRGLVPRVSQR
jgi:hypothetical protein